MCNAAALGKLTILKYINIQNYPFLMTDNQINVPAYPEDHKVFKKKAADLEISMKDLFHKITERYVKKLKAGDLE